MTNVVLWGYVKLTLGHKPQTHLRLIDSSTYNPPEKS